MKNRILESSEKRFPCLWWALNCKGKEFLIGVQKLVENLLQILWSTRKFSRLRNSLRNRSNKIVSVSWESFKSLRMALDSLNIMQISRISTRLSSALINLSYPPQASRIFSISLQVWTNLMRFLWGTDLFAFRGRRKSLLFASFFFNTMHSYISYNMYVPLHWISS